MERAAFEGTDLEGAAFEGADLEGIAFEDKLSKDRLFEIAATDEPFKATSLDLEPKIFDVCSLAEVLLKLLDVTAAAFPKDAVFEVALLANKSSWSLLTDFFSPCRNIGFALCVFPGSDCTDAFEPTYF